MIWSISSCEGEFLGGCYALVIPESSSMLCLHLVLTTLTKFCQCGPIRERKLNIAGISLKYIFLQHITIAILRTPVFILSGYPISITSFLSSLPPHPNPSHSLPQPEIEERHNTPQRFFLDPTFIRHIQIRPQSKPMFHPLE